MDTEHPLERRRHRALVDRLCARVAEAGEGVLDLRDRPERRVVRRWLAARLTIGVAPGLPVLVADELVANAYEHAATPLRLRYTRHRAGLLLEVSDDSPRAAETLAALRDGVRGFGTGLSVVANLSLAWGVDRDAAQKTVWALMPARTPPPAGEGAAE